MKLESASSLNLQDAWDGLLAVVTVDQIADVVNGTTTSVAWLIGNDGGDGISLREAILATNADIGLDEIHFEITDPGRSAG